MLTTSFKGNPSLIYTFCPSLWIRWTLYEVCLHPTKHNLCGIQACSVTHIACLGMLTTILKRNPSPIYIFCPSLWLRWTLDKVCFHPTKHNLRGIQACWVTHVACMCTSCLDMLTTSLKRNPSPIYIFCPSLWLRWTLDKVCLHPTKHNLCGIQACSVTHVACVHVQSSATQLTYLYTRLHETWPF